MKTEALIKYLSRFHPKGYDLSLGRISGLLEKLGSPQHNLPPVFHVAGTNGKGSVIANLRALLEAANVSTHVHTSPHLVNYHERYRLAHDKNNGEQSGTLVDDEMLAQVLGRVADANGGQKITVFELLAAAMFLLFSEQPADTAIIEVGLGGRFDASNIICKPQVAIITTISLDHEMHLGNTIAKIAFEKGGIIKPDCAVVIGPQEDEARGVLEEIALANQCPTMICGQDFDFYEEGGRFIYQDIEGLLDLPMPALLGAHQLANSATAIAALRLGKYDVDEGSIARAMGELYWPGRFERLLAGNLMNKYSTRSEIWIDGGHNEGAGEVIALEMAKLNEKHPKPLKMICAMLVSKDPEGYFRNFKSLEPQVICVPIISSDYGIEENALAGSARNAGLDAVACMRLEDALEQALEGEADCRILICGSLYLVGEVLKKNGTPPT